MISGLLGEGDLRSTLVNHGQRKIQMVQKGEWNMRKLIDLIKDEEGVTAIEYGLIAAGIGIAIAGVVVTVGNQLVTFFNKVVTALGG